MKNNITPGPDIRDLWKLLFIMLISSAFLYCVLGYFIVFFQAHEGNYAPVTVWVGCIILLVWSHWSKKSPIYGWGNETGD